MKTREDWEWGAYIVYMLINNNTGIVVYWHNPDAITSSVNTVAALRIQDGVAVNPMRNSGGEKPAEPATREATKFTKVL